MWLPYFFFPYHIRYNEEIVSQKTNAISRHGHEWSCARFTYGIVSNAIVHSNVFFVQSSQLHPGCSHKGFWTLARMYRSLVFFFCKWNIKFIYRILYNTPCIRANLNANIWRLNISKENAQMPKFWQLNIYNFFRRDFFHICNNLI